MARPPFHLPTPAEIAAAKAWVDAQDAANTAALPDAEDPRDAEARRIVEADRAMADAIVDEWEGEERAPVRVRQAEPSMADLAREYAPTCREAQELLRDMEGR